MQIWKEIKGYEGLYEISNYGEVRSLDRCIVKSNGVKQHKKGRMMVPVKNSDGYLIIKLSKNKKRKSIAVHRLVAEAFIDYPADESKVYEVNHIDCNRENNNVDNLEWITHIDNVRYSIKNKNHFCTRNLFGKNNPNYQNHILSEIYKNNPELAIEKLARPGGQNGRAVRVRMYDNTFTTYKDFDWIGECAQYLIDNNFTSAKVNSIRDNISNSIKTNKPYLNHYYEKIA